MASVRAREKHSEHLQQRRQAAPDGISDAIDEAIDFISEFEEDFPDTGTLLARLREARKLAGDHIMNREQAIRLIHVARRDLAIDDDAWRDLLREKFKVESSTELGIVDLYAVIAHLKKCGFKVRHPKKKPGPALSRPLEGAAQRYPGDAAKLRALWLFMAHELHVIRSDDEASLAAYAKRITGIEALQWLDGQQTYRVIESLKKWAERFFPDKIAARVQLVNDAIAKSGRRANPDLLIKYRAALAKFEGSQTKKTKRPAYDACLAVWHALDDLLLDVTRPDEPKGVSK
jgi:phage gp16-like protein